MHWSAVPHHSLKDWFCVCVVLVLLLCDPLTGSLIDSYIMMIVATIDGIFMVILFILNYPFKLSVTK